VGTKLGVHIVNSWFKTRKRSIENRIHLSKGIRRPSEIGAFSTFHGAGTAHGVRVFWPSFFTLSLVPYAVCRVIGPVNGDRNRGLSSYSEDLTQTLCLFC